MKDNFKDKVVYQIYPKSFSDSNDDGIGDIQGIIKKLGYLKTLGVDYIWLTPIYPSPQNDNGYDVANYYDIDPIYGTMSDFEQLISECKNLNIKIMLDMVFNHTSTEHEWFKKAISGDKNYQDYYIFKKGKDNKTEPTNWQSKFGGSAWEYVEALDTYYLHLFDKTQADLNWDNEKVRKEIYKVVNFWIEKGVKGFRFDVINLISKPSSFEDDPASLGKKYYTDGINIHKYLKELNENTFGKYEDIITVGEMASTSIENCILYSNESEKELSMTFSFHHLKVDYKNGDKWQLQPFDFNRLKSLLSDWQIKMTQNGGWNALFWCNHDQPRVVSRFGDDGKYHKKSAKMLATAIHCLSGTPYIYQGEEIGMTNAGFSDISQYKDVESHNAFDILKTKGVSKADIYEVLSKRSRDNSRTPMQWDDSYYAGFSNSMPWIGVNSNKDKINAGAQVDDNDSIFTYYKTLIKLRKKYDVIAHGEFRLILKETNNVFAYERITDNESLIVICNFYGKKAQIDLTADIESYTCILSNYNNVAAKKRFTLRPYEVIVLYRQI